MPALSPHCLKSQTVIGQGYRVATDSDPAFRAREVRSQNEHQPPFKTYGEVNIMDVGLPDIDGRETVRILRRNGFRVPIIMLTGHDTNADLSRVHALAG
jgi:DNA-binding response OmpR family regulator